MQISADGDLGLRNTEAFLSVFSYSNPSLLVLAPRKTAIPHRRWGLQVCRWFAVLWPVSVGRAYLA